MHVVVYAVFEDGYEADVAATAMAGTGWAVQCHFAHLDPAVWARFKGWVLVHQARRSSGCGAQ